MNFLRNRHGWILLISLILFFVIIFCMSYSSFIYSKLIQLPIEPITPVVSSEKHFSVLSNALHFQFPLSREVIVFNAFVDTRVRTYVNTTMIFIAASKEVLSQKRIIGCGIGQTLAKKFVVRYVFEDLLMHRWYGKPVFP